MKEKIKNTKGITLVALIITIIVLLILAVVGITSINNNKILEYAKNGRDAYNQGRTNETETITEYEKYLDDNNPNKNGSPTEYPFVGKMYYNIDKDDRYNVYIIKNDASEYSLNYYYHGTKDGENKYTFLASESYTCKIISKNNSEFKNYFDEEYGNSDKGDPINFNRVQEYVLEITDNGDTWYGFFLDSYENANIDGDCTLTTDAAIKAGIDAVGK